MLMYNYYYVFQSSVSLKKGYKISEKVKLSIVTDHLAPKWRKIVAKNLKEQVDGIVVV